MKKKGQMMIVGMSIAVILAVVIFTVIFSVIDENLKQTAIDADQFTAVNATCTRVTDQCITKGSTSTVLNATGTGATAIMTGNFTECGASGDLYGYNLKATGLAVLDGSTMNASYTEEGCGYIQSGTTRTLVSVIPILLALLILVFIAGFAIVKRS